MLLINSKGSRIGANCEKGEEVEKKVKRSCVIVIVNRDRREGEIDCFDREIIFVHNIDFLDVLDDVIDFFDVITDVVGGAVDAEEAVDFIEVDGGGELEIGGISGVEGGDTGDTDDIGVEGAGGGEAGEVGGVDGVGGVVGA